MYMRQDNYLAFFAAFLAFLSTVATFLIALPGFEAPFAIPTLSGHIVLIASLLYLCL